VAKLEGRVVDPPGWRLALEVRPDVVGRWSKIEIQVTDDGLPVEERHYDRRGRLARVLTFDQVKTLGGRRLPTRVALVPADEQGRRTELHYLDIAFDVPIPDDTFSLSRLEENR